VIDFTFDDSLPNKGKQKVDVEMVDVLDRPRTSVTLDGDAAEASGRWPDFAELALVRAEEELPRWGRSILEFRDAANPDTEPFFALNDKDEVQHWEYIKGLCKHSVRSLRMVTDTLVWQMSGAFEVSHVRFNISLGPYPLFPLGSDFGFNHGQELKERSHRKSLLIHHESGVWAALPRQRALIEEVNKRLSKKSVEANELPVAHVALREEAAQAREVVAKAREDTTKAQEEAAKTREDHAPLLAHVKELEEDVTLASGQRDALNV
jgi:hypothetical protein